ncbi:MaoC family dehydratase [Paraburkholderia sp. BCC1886]|uniref:MaoC family dehydratase n=1 Tax=Paraburkholderia sp. BCC1886 TaxID=2562670 RepID=UPI001181F97D|nr:MaoC family dehydratase [Paraburkholderia sp. BCC1886]
MNVLRFDTIQIGDTLPPLALPPIDRTTLALFAGASGDHNAVHIDLDFARRTGMPDVFAHGMLSMAYLGRLLTEWVDPRQLRQFAVRFVGITHLGHQITCCGQVVDKFETHGESRVKVEIQTRNQYGDTRVVGDAVIAII